MSTPPFEELPLDRLLKANEVCNRLENALHHGEPVRVEDFLTEVIEEDRPLLRRELDAIVKERGEAAPSQPPQEVGEYVLEDELGRGGMGVVYRAVHRTMKRRVAIKFLHVAESEQQADADQRFQREVEMLARLHHPNLVLAFDAGRQGAWRYLVTELIDGIDLARRVRTHGPLSAEQAIDVLEQTCVGLEYLHAQGIVHRDLKPANLMIDKSGRVRILDVGLARALGGNPDDSLTKAGWIIGTVEYMAPEQADGAKQADARSDLYSVGCTLFYLLEGKPPFTGNTPFDVLVAQRDQPAPELGTTVPRELRDLFGDLVAKHPNARPTTAATVRQRLRAMRRPGNEATEVFRVQTPPKRPRTIGLLLAGLAAAILAAVGIWWFTRTEPAEPPTLATNPLDDPGAYQRRWAKHLNLPVAVTDDTGIAFVFIPPGRFRMGTPDEELNPMVMREPGEAVRAKMLTEKAHNLEIPRPFYLGAKEVTIGQFRRFIDANGLTTHTEKWGAGWGVVDGEWVQQKGFCWHDFGEQSAADDVPVGNITWDEAEAFCRWLTGLSKGRARYRLPVEAEWEYACRAGSVTPFCCSERGLARYAVYKANSQNRLRPTGSLEASAFGLFDMHGNHNEWCGLAAPSSPLFTPIPSDDPTQRPSRGGGFFDTPERIRSAARDWAHLSSMGKGGFRVLKEIAE